jgi:hypothetical protein
MIGDNVVLRPPRLSRNTKRLITFAVRVARLMRWVYLRLKVHTLRSYGDPIQRRQWNYGQLRADRAKSSRNDEAALTKTDTICGREAGTRRSQNRRRDVMRQQHAVVGAAIPLPCENERRRSLGAERECEVCRLGGRAAIDSGSHGGGGGLVGGSTAALFGLFLVFFGQTREGRVGGLWGRPRAKKMD